MFVSLCVSFIQIQNLQEKFCIKTFSLKKTNILIESRLLWVINIKHKKSNIQYKSFIFLSLQTKNQLKSTHPTESITFQKYIQRTLQTK